MHYFRQSAATWARYLLFLICATGFAKIAPAGGTGLLIRGKITDLQGKPLDGCLVSIAAAPSTRSRGVLTEQGNFEVPITSDSGAQLSTVPYLEVYWDQQLIFRQPLTSLRIENENAGSSMQTWIYYLRYGGEISLSPIAVSP
jgi:hypothetical protein